MTAHSNGLINVKDASKSDDSTDTPGNIMRSSKIGDLNGITCDKFGNEVQDVKSSDVLYIPNTQLNSFSVSKNKKWMNIRSRF